MINFKYVSRSRLSAIYRCMYSSFDIAKKILELSERDNQSVSPMKLIKLVYIMHGWHLGTRGTPLINDNIQAWQYGPVIPELYEVIKRFGTAPVDPKLILLYAKKELEPEDSEFIESVWPSYKDFSALELSALTHLQGSPWSQNYNNDERSIPIPNEAIKSYYSDLIMNSQPENVSS